MKVSELFDRLATGPLSDLNLSDSKTGKILPEYYKKIINYTNSGLLQLYSRFVLSTKTVMLETKAHITSYHIDSRYSQQSGKECITPYIIDWPHDPFKDDAIKILGVNQEGYGRRPLNDRNDCQSFFTPSPLVLEVPKPIEGASLSIIYQARQEPLKVDIEHPEKVLKCELGIPFYLEDPLINFISSEYYTHMNGQENLAIGLAYHAKYDAACVEILDRDLHNETAYTTDYKFLSRGFV